MIYSGSTDIRNKRRCAHTPAPNPSPHTHTPSAHTGPTHLIWYPPPHGAEHGPQSLQSVANTQPSVQSTSLHTVYLCKAQPRRTASTSHSWCMSHHGIHAPPWMGGCRATGPGQQRGHRAHRGCWVGQHGNRRSGSNDRGDTSAPRPPPPCALPSAPLHTTQRPCCRHACISTTAAQWVGKGESACLGWTYRVRFLSATSHTPGYTAGLATDRTCFDRPAHSNKSQPYVFC